MRFAVGIAGVENGHLEILGKIAIVFSDTDEVDKLLAAPSAQELYRPPERGQRGMSGIAVHFGAGLTWTRDLDALGHD